VAGVLHIGCSGWAYRDWKGPFYPPDLKDSARLSFYQSRFSTVEINASFYRLPSEAAVEAWATAASPGFVYAWKASRYITHNKKLKDCQDSIALVLGRMAPLGKEGPVLFQLPPSLKQDIERLSQFAGWLPKGRRYAIEFRHPSWYAPDIFELLRKRNIALCISDHHHAPAPFEVTADFVYLRGHGPGGRYFGRYGAEALNDWAAHIKGWQAKGLAVFCYFDNDIKSAAPADAAELIGLLKD
jgi:uncharacterized protein YecE (DUF72 family)